LNIFRFKPFRALKLHAGKPHRISVIYLRLQMFSVAINTETVSTCQRKKVSWIVIQIAAFAELPANFNW